MGRVWGQARGTFCFDNDSFCADSGRGQVSCDEGMFHVQSYCLMCAVGMSHVQGSSLVCRCHVPSTLGSMFNYPEEYVQLPSGVCSVSYTHLTLPTTPYV